MDTLPLEILQTIFKLACSDGGYTGCSLSRTSKDIRAAARTIRCQAVSLIAYPARLESFLELYARECEPTLGDPPKVDHLHLVIPPSLGPRRFICGGVFTPLPQTEARFPIVVTPTTQPFTTKPSAPLTGSDMHFSSRPSDSPEYREAAHTLARLVAPHLHTLVIQRGFRCQVKLLAPTLAFIDTPFPRVREITLLGLSDVGEFIVPHAHAPPLFPAAARLHFVRKGLAGHDCLDFWRTHAPRATHLRMSCLRAPFGKFVPSLARSVGIAHMPDLPPPRSRTYPSLRALVLHQDAPTGADMERPATVEAYMALMASLEHFGNACPAQGVKAVVVPPFYMHFEDWGVKLKEEWLDRLSGGGGCWKELELAGE
ncbi:hypothetical protein BC628DRAFT_1314627 [Trametes gibbosa]|nr:hypothetical protein BC628DRAFT_1314627 [Trametes gibbosa]